MDVLAINPGKVNSDDHTVVRTLTTTNIIIFVVAAITPLSQVVGSVPLGLAFGGPSATLMFVAAGIVLGLFCVGYIQMVRRISRPGAFYTYISRGLGRPIGVGSAFVAVIGYTVLLLSTLAIAGVVQAQIIKGFRVDLAWQLHMASILVIVALLAYRRIELSARVTISIVVLEIAALAALVVAIAFHKGLSGAFPLEALKPSVFKQGNWTVAFVFAMLCFQGFEAAALYAPEAKDPQRTIPRGLVGSLFILIVTFALTTWALTGSTGVAEQQAVVNADIAGFVFTAFSTYLGSAGILFLSLLVLPAQIACALSYTNFMSRYLQSLSDEGLLPRLFSLDNHHGAPAGAMFCLLIFSAVIVYGSTLVGIDPYFDIAPVGFGIGALGATTLQALASLAVVCFFLRLPVSERHWFKTLLAPALAAVLLLGSLLIEAVSFAYITGKDTPTTAMLPWIIPAVFLLGVVFALWLKKNRPLTYSRLAEGDTAEDVAALRHARAAASAARPIRQ